MLHKSSRFLSGKFPFGVKKNFTQVQRGIFGLSHFRSKTIPDGRESKVLIDHTLNTIEKCERLVDKFISLDNSTEMIEIIDNISNDSCVIIDGATALYQLHNDAELKQQCFEAMLRIGNFFEKLNTNKKFYNKALQLYFSDMITSGLLLQDERLAVLEKNVEELALINKKNSNPENEDISTRIENRCGEIENPSETRYPFSISEGEIKSLNSQILKTILKVYINNNGIMEDEQGVYRFDADYGLLSTILNKSDLKELTNRAYVAISDTYGCRNIDKFVEVLKLRLKYAQNLGYKSFADYNLQMQTLKLSPQDLISILKQMWVDIRPNLILDLKNIFIEDESGKNNLMVDRNNYDPYLTYYEIDSLRSSYLDQSLKTLDDKVITRRFITVSNVFNGLRLLTKHLFGKDLRPVMDEDEIKEEMIDDSILLAYLYDGDRRIAKIYFDLFVRPGKTRGIFSQMTIQGSKLINPYNRKIRQIPITILSTNFEVTDLDILNMQLSFTDAKGIFHEYGHVLHSCLSATDYQSLSGSRIPLDFAEIPSHVFEYFMYDYSFCKLWMVDSKSNTVLDENLFKLFCMPTEKFANLDLQKTLYNSIFDLMIHSIENENDITKGKLCEIHQSLIDEYNISSIFPIRKESFAEFDRILSKYEGKINLKNGLDNYYKRIINDSTVSPIQHDKNFDIEIDQMFKRMKEDEEFLKSKLAKSQIFKGDLMFTTGHNHFKNYPSMYYTYINGKVFSNLIWLDCYLNNDIRQFGQMLELELLSKGYTESPRRLINNLFNRMNKLI